MKDSRMTACYWTGQSVYNFGLPDVHGVTRINLSRYRGKVTTCVQYRILRYGSHHSFLVVIARYINKKYIYSICIFFQNFNFTWHII